MTGTSRRRQAVLLAIAGVCLVVVDLPLLYMLSSSFKTTAEIYSSTAILPIRPTLANYAFLLQQSPFPRFLLNSLIVSTGATVLALIPAVMAGYALSRYRSRALGLYSSLILVFQMFPAMLMLIPLFLIMSALHLIDTYGSVILINGAFILPYAVWVGRAFFDGIPIDLEEAAWVDGASRWQGLARVVVPLSAPGIASIAVFCFIGAWNEYLLGSIFLRDESVMTIPVGIQSFTQQYTSDWGNIMAAATLAMVPSIVIFGLLQRYMVAGALAGSVKG